MVTRVGVSALALLAAITAAEGSTAAPQAAGKVGFGAPAPCEDDVVLVGADPTGRLKLDAYGGRLDARLRLEARAPAGAKPGETRTVTLSLQAPTLPDHKVSVRNPEGVRDEQKPSAFKIGVPLGSYAMVEVSGVAFQPGQLHFIPLTIMSCRLRSFELEVVAHPLALGLRATDLSPAPEKVAAFGKRSVSACLPIDPVTPPLTSDMVHVSVGALAKPADDEDPLSYDQVKVTPNVPCGGLLVTVDGLEAGRYGATLRINDRDVTLHLTVRNGPWIVVIILALGFGLVTGIQAWFAFRGVRTANLRAISEVDAALEQTLKKLKVSFNLDELGVRNALRRARACNTAFRLAEAETAVKAAKERLQTLDRRKQTDTIMDAAFRDTLPAEIRERLENDVAHLKGLADADDAPLIEKGLESLEGEAKRGFRERLMIWLLALRDTAAPMIGNLGAVLVSPPGWLGQEEKGSALAAVFALKQDLVEALDRTAKTPDKKRVELERPHVDLLVRLVPSLEAIEKWLAGGGKVRAPDLIAIAHGEIENMPSASPSTSSKKTIGAAQPVSSATGTSPFAPRELAVRGGRAIDRRFLARGKRYIVHTAREVTFKADNRSGVIAWSVERRRWKKRQPIAVIVSSSASLTFVFDGSGCYDVEARFDDGVKEGAVVVARDFDNAVVQDARRSGLMKLGTTVLAVGIGSVIAVALFWVRKGFGSPRDYVAVFTTGIGANVGLGAVAPFFDVVRGRLRGDGAASGAKPADSKSKESG